LNRLAKRVNTDFNDLCLNLHISSDMTSSKHTPLSPTTTSTPGDQPEGKYDVFLCYNREDRRNVKDIGNQLKAMGLAPWLDEWELRPGLPWQRLLEEQITSINTVAVFIGQSGLGPWQQMEIEAFLRQFVSRGCPVIPVLLPNAPDKPKLPVFLSGMTWVDFRASQRHNADEEPLDRLIWGITGEHEQRRQVRDSNANNTPPSASQSPSLAPETQDPPREHILIASLGDSPVVVSSMYHKLTEEYNTSIDRIIVLHPEDDDEVQKAYKLVREHLQGKCVVEYEPLPFKDANSWSKACLFLQRLYKLLRSVQQAGATVYLSLAGGRKSMAALTAWVAPFFPCVQHLYHIIDKDENNFLSVEDLYNLSSHNRNLAMHSDLEQLFLVDIPFAREQNIGQQLHDHLLSAAKDEWDELFTQAVIGDAKLLDVWVTKQVFDQFCALCKNDVRRAFELQNCFERMSLPSQLQAASFSADKLKIPQCPQMQFFQSLVSPIRIFFYRKPGKDDASNSDNTQEQIIVCAFDITVNGTYRKLTEIKAASADFSIDALCSVGQLPPVPYAPSDTPRTDSVLIVPLGNRPMIATQLYQLLTYQGRRHIHEVFLVYPEQLKISNAATIVKDALQRLSPGVPCTCRLITGLTDITKDKHCTIYQEALEKVIDEARDKYPSSDETNYRIDLALSGGRKGMTAMTIFAAQHKGIRYVYHTLITDEVLNDQIEKKTTIDMLGKIDDEEELDNLLFLQAYNKDGLYTGFTLFPVPVFPVDNEG
jgi:CRISPR-associated Csx14 family protein